MRGSAQAAGEAAWPAQVAPGQWTWASGSDRVAEKDAFGIYGTKGSVQWDFQQPNEIIVGRRDEPNQILQRNTPGFDADIANYTDIAPVMQISQVAVERG